MLHQTIQLEYKISNLSQEINPHNLFDKLNKKDKEFLKECDFNNFFNDNAYYVIKEDLKYLIRRFDKDQDGRISYKEFLDHFN